MSSTELDLLQLLTDVGAAAGVAPASGDTPQAFAARIGAAITAIKAAAGITWAEFTCVDGHALIAPRDHLGVRWAIARGASLEDLAGQMSEWERVTTTPEPGRG